MLGYDAQAGSEFEFNPTKAKQLLADAGYPNGQGFPTVPYNYVAGANGQRYGEWMQAQLLQILNVNIELQPMENAQYQKATSEPTNKIPGIGRSGWCSDYNYPSDWLGLVFKSGGPAGNPNNIPGFNDPAYDKLSDAADAEIDPAKAAAAYKAAQKELIAQAPVVFSGVSLFDFMQNSKVKLTTAPSDGGMPGSINWESVDITG
jgi:oligopeptide transport system substrate-binding protein